MERLNSYLTFLALMGYLFAVRVVLNVYFDDSVFPHASQRETFAPLFLACLTGAGLLGVALAQLTGFPEMWDRRVSAIHRFLLPALLGILFGVLEIEADRLTNLTQLAVEALHIPFFHMRFPASLLVYPGGAIIVDTLFRLVPIPLCMALTLGLVWLIARWRRAPVQWACWQNRIFWFYALLLSWFEPVTQSGIISLVRGKPGLFPGHDGLVFWEAGTEYLFNLFQAILFRRAGFLACLTMRVSMYLVWHVLWGYLGQLFAAVPLSI